MNLWEQVTAIRKRWDAVVIRVPETDVTMAAQAKDDITLLLNLLDRAKEALIWCSGSNDFNAGGVARAGWMKEVQPLLDGKSLGEPIIPGHPLWRKFIDRLEGPEGCNFREINPGHSTWDCAGGMDKSKATAILLNMGISEEAIAASLRFYQDHGGHCDCEIIFNIAHPHERAPRGRPLPAQRDQSTHHVADKEEFRS